MFSRINATTHTSQKRVHTYSTRCTHAYTVTQYVVWFGNLRSFTHTYIMCVFVLWMCTNAFHPYQIVCVCIRLAHLQFSTSKYIQTLFIFVNIVFFSLSFSLSLSLTCSAFNIKFLNNFTFVLVRTTLRAIDLFV